MEKKNTHNTFSGTGQDETRLKDFRQNAEDAFMVPKGYFEMLPGKIEAVTTNKKPTYNKPAIKSITRSKTFYLVAATGIAATVVVLFAVRKPQATQPAAEVASEIALAYDPTYADEALILENSEIENQLEQAGETNDLFNPASTINDTDIKEYLNEQEIETELLQP